MSLDLQPTSLLHPDQALTVSQAACWVQHLIDCYTQNVGMLQPFTLDETALQDYAARLETLLEHAGVLEQLLCRMCFFLPEEASRTIIAIIVATHHQVGLLETDTGVGTNARFILDGQTIEDMADYLQRVLARLTATHDWVQSDEYARLRDAVADALSHMRESLSLSISTMDAGSAESSTPPRSPATTERNGPEFSRLISFMSVLSPSQFSSRVRDLPDIDWRLLCANYKPLLLSDVPSLNPPYLDPDSYTCGESEDAQSISSSSSTVYSVPAEQHKGKAKAMVDAPMLFQDTSFHDQWSWSSCQPLPPTYIPPVVHPWHVSSSASMPQPPFTRSNLKRRRTEAHKLPKPKKRRVSVVVYGADGCVADCSTHEAVVRRVQPFIGHAIPLTPNLSPSKLPRSRRIYYSSPNASNLELSSPASFSSSPLPPHSLYSYLSASPPSFVGASPPSLPSITLPIVSLPPMSGKDVDNDDEESHSNLSVAATIGSDSDGSEFDENCVSESWSSHTVYTRNTASDENPDVGMVNENPRVAKLSSQRSCWAGLLHAMSRIFSL